MNFVILFLFSTIVFTVNSESTKDHSHSISKKNVDNQEERNSNTNDNGEIASENKNERVKDRSVSNSNGKKYRDEDKSVDTHAKEIDEWIEKLPENQRYGARRADREWYGRAKGRETKLEDKLEACRSYEKMAVIATDLRYAIEQLPKMIILTIDRATERQGKIIAEILQSIRTIQNAFIKIIKYLIRLSFDDKMNFESIWSKLKQFPIVQVQIGQISNPFEKAIVNLKNTDRIEEAKKIWEENKRLWEARIVDENKKNEKENNVDQKKAGTKKIRLLKGDIPLIKKLTSMNKSKEIQHYVKIDVLCKQTLNLKDTEKLYVDHVISVGRVFSQDLNKTYKQCTIALAMTSESDSKALIDQFKLKKNWEKMNTWSIIDTFYMTESYLYSQVSNVDLYGPQSRFAARLCRAEKEDLKSYINLFFGKNDFVYDVAEFLTDRFPREIKKE